jgi:hypothetical protein
MNQLPEGGYYEIFNKWGTYLIECPLLQKYQSTPKELILQLMQVIHARREGL